MSGPWTNQVVSTVIVGQAGTPQVIIMESGGIGQVIIAFGQPGLQQASIFGGIAGSGATEFASMVLDGPVNSTATDTDDQVYIQLDSNNSGATAFANGRLMYVSDQATSSQTTEMGRWDGDGVTLDICNAIYCINPTFPYPPARETWHQATLINSWAASGSGVNGLFYRALPIGDGIIEIIADIKNTTATGNSTCFTLPTGWIPQIVSNHPAAWNNPAASNSATPPWVNVDASGNIGITGIEVANKPIFFHIFVPYTLTA